MPRLWTALVASTALLSASAAHARPYIVAVYSPAALQFIDLSSIARLPASHRTAQLTSIAAKGGTLDGLSTVAHLLSLEVDCAQGRLRVMKAQFFNAQLQPVFAAPSGLNSGWNTTEAGSAGDATLQVICRADASTHPTLDIDRLDALIERVQRALGPPLP